MQMEWNHRGGDASTSNEPDVRIKWIISKRPIASKQLGIMAVICSSITAKGPVQTNNPQYISATFYSLGIYFS
jgi:hypothetical protein